jgi:hypothetical protein
MFKIAILLIGLAIVAGIVLWSKSPTVDAVTTTQGMSFAEMHARAHLESLPVQEFEDQSLIYPVLAQREEK